MSWAEHVVVHHAASAARDRGRRRNRASAARLIRDDHVGPAPQLAGPTADVPSAVTACLRSLLVTWMLRGLAASWTGMVRVSTPAA